MHTAAASQQSLQQAFQKLDHLWHLYVVNLGNGTCAGPGRLVGGIAEQCGGMALLV